jgi:hypothetical protein
MSMIFEPVNEQIIFKAEFEMPMNYKKLDLLIEFLSPLSSLPESIRRCSFVKNLSRYNLFEYKSPKESMTFRDFVSLHGLCCLHFDQNADKIAELSDIGAVLVSTSYPREMIAQLKKHDYSVDKFDDGIYLIKGPNLQFRFQIVVIRELDEANNALLKTLQNSLSEKQADAILREAKIGDDKKLFTKRELKMQNDVVEFFREHGLLDKILNETRKEARKEAIRETTAKNTVELKTDDIFRVFSARFKSKPKTLRTKISRIKNTNKLNEIRELAATCSSVDEFTAALS